MTSNTGGLAMQSPVANPEMLLHHDGGFTIGDEGV